MEKSQLSMPTFLWQGLFFVATQILGVLTAVRIRELEEIGALDIDIEQVSAPPDMVPWKFLLTLVIVIALTILIIKLPRGKGIVFKSLFALTAWWGGSLALSLWVNYLAALAIMSAAILFWLLRSNVLSQNILVLLGIAGVGGMFGLRFVPESVVFLMILFSVYDVIAVYKTKHMIKLARAMIEAKALFAIIAPDKISKFLVRVKDIEPQKGFMILGGGDIAFPTMLAASVSAESFEKALLVTGFSLIGLFSTLIVFFGLGKKPMPALPPIAVFSILGFLISKGA